MTPVDAIDFDPDDCIALMPITPPSKATIEFVDTMLSLAAGQPPVRSDLSTLNSQPSTAASPRWTYRDYQYRAFTAIEQAWLDCHALLIVLATGLGKTVIFTHVARMTVAAGGKVLIIAHSEELLDQAADKLERSTGLKAAKEKANAHATTYDSIVLASVQTLARPARLQGWPRDHFQLVIVDEAHRSRAKSYETIINYFLGRSDQSLNSQPSTLNSSPTPPLPPASPSRTRLLGVTATADRGDKKSLADVYERVAFEFNLLEAVHEGWLVRPRVETIPMEIDLKGVKTSRTSQGSDYDLTEVAHRIEPFLSEIARQLARRVAGKGQGIVFLPSVATARMMAECLVAAGIQADYVSGECDNRSEKIAAYKAGKLRVLCNAMLLIEGFDHDAIDWITVLRPTKIRSLYVQAVGRVTRPLNAIIAALNAAADAAARKLIIAASAKREFWIYDFLFLTEKLDLITPVHLVAKNDAVAKQMQEARKDGDLIDLEAMAERDLLESLRKAAEKNSKKKGRVIDPLAFAVAVNDDTIAAYEPSSRWEFKPPSEEQIKVLQNNGIDGAKIQTMGLASKVIDKIFQRQRLGLCSVRQMSFLERLGFKEAALMTKAQAGHIISQKKKAWEIKRQNPSDHTAHAPESTLPIDDFH